MQMASSQSWQAISVAIKPSAKPAGEAEEESERVIDPPALDLFHIAHRMTHAGRIFFFTTAKCQGKPQNLEPHKRDDLSWSDLGNLPSNTVGEVRGALTAGITGRRYSEFGWEFKFASAGTSRSGGARNVCKQGPIVALECSPAA